MFKASRAFADAFFVVAGGEEGLVHFDGEGIAGASFGGGRAGLLLFDGHCGFMFGVGSGNDGDDGGGGFVGGGPC